MAFTLSLALLAGAVDAAPPTPKTFACEGGSCVISARGLPLSECEQACTPPPNANYTCSGGQCVTSARGLPQAACTQICGGPGPAPPGPPGPAPPIPFNGSTVVDLAVATPELSTLVKALKAAGLVDALSGNGPFTVFAPSNKAFAAAAVNGQPSIDLLPKQELVDILSYHVAVAACDYPFNSPRGAKDLCPNCPGDSQCLTCVPDECLNLETLWSQGPPGDTRGLNKGQTILVNEQAPKCGRQERNKCKEVALRTRTVQPRRATPDVTSVPIVKAGIRAANGIVHIIDSVLVAPRPKTIADLIAKQPDLSTLATALAAAGLDATFSANVLGLEYTVFAPTNEAFARLPAGVLANLLKPENKAELVTLLTYHVVAGNVLSTDITNGETVKTENGNSVTTRVVKKSVNEPEGIIFINSATVTKANQIAGVGDSQCAGQAECDTAAGIVHTIDSVLSPPRGPVGGRPTLTFFVTTNVDGGLVPQCGDIDAAPRMPPALFEQGNFVALQAYIAITLELWSKFGIGVGRDGLVYAMGVGTCADFVQPGAARWTPQGSRTMQAAWAPVGLMTAICAKQCNCAFTPNATETAPARSNLSPCTDGPDNPTAMTWCSLCGPKFNQPIEINLYSCDNGHASGCRELRRVKPYVSVGDRIGDSIGDSISGSIRRALPIAANSSFPF